MGYCALPPGHDPLMGPEGALLPAGWREGRPVNLPPVLFLNDQPPLEHGVSECVDRSVGQDHPVPLSRRRRNKPNERSVAGVISHRLTSLPEGSSVSEKRQSAGMATWTWFRWARWTFAEYR